MFRPLLVAALLAVPAEAGIHADGRITADKLPGDSATVAIVDASGNDICDGSFSKAGDAFTCDLDWSKDYSVKVDVQLGQSIDASYRVKADMKVKASLLSVPLTIDCALCGANCSFKVPIVGKTVDIQMPPCPITSQAQTVAFSIPADPLPVNAKISGTGSVTVAGAAMGAASFEGSISKRSALINQSALALAAPSPISVDTSCTKANPEMQGLKVDISPNPPVPGQALTISISGTNAADVSKLTATVSGNIVAKVGFVPVSIPIAEIAVPIALSPGIQKGPFSAVVGPINLPSTLPKVPVSADIKIDLATTDADIACFEIKGSI